MVFEQWKQPFRFNSGRPVNTSKRFPTRDLSPPAESPKTQQVSNIDRPTRVTKRRARKRRRSNNSNRPQHRAMPPTPDQSPPRSRQTKLDSDLEQEAGSRLHYPAGTTNHDLPSRRGKESPDEAIDTLSELLYSPVYLQALLHSTKYLPRFIAFLEKYKPTISHLVAHYLGTQKVIKTVDYANAVAATLSIRNFNEAGAPANLSPEFRKSSDDAFQILLNIALPSWISFCQLPIKSRLEDQKDQNGVPHVDEEEMESIETNQDTDKISSTEAQIPITGPLNGLPARPRAKSVKSLVEKFENVEGKQDNTKATVDGLAALLSTLDLHDESTEAKQEAQTSTSKISPIAPDSKATNEELQSLKSSMDGLETPPASLPKLPPSLESEDETQEKTKASRDTSGTVSPKPLPSSGVYDGKSESVDVDEAASVPLPDSSIIPPLSMNGLEETHESVEEAKDEDGKPEATLSQKQEQSTLVKEQPEDVSESMKNTQDSSSTSSSSPPALLLTIDYLKNEAETTEAEDQGEPETTIEASQNQIVVSSIESDNDMSDNKQLVRETSNSPSENSPALLLTIDYVNANPQHAETEGVEASQDDPESSSTGVQSEPLALPLASHNEDIRVLDAAEDSSTVIRNTSPALAPVLNLDHREEIFENSEDVERGESPSTSPPTMLPAAQTQLQNSITGAWENSNDIKQSRKRPDSSSEVHEASEIASAKAIDEDDKDNIRPPILAPPSSPPAQDILIAEEVPMNETDDSKDNVQSPAHASPSLLSAQDIPLSEDIPFNETDEDKDNTRSPTLASPSSLLAQNVPIAEQTPTIETDDDKDNIPSPGHTSPSLLLARDNPIIEEIATKEIKGDDNNNIPWLTHTSPSLLLAQDVRIIEEASDKPEDDVINLEESSSTSPKQLPALGNQVSDKALEIEEHAQDNTTISSTSLPPPQAPDSPSISPKSSPAPILALELPAPEEVFKDESDEDSHSSSATVSPITRPFLAVCPAKDMSSSENTHDIPSSPRALPEMLPSLSSQSPGLFESPETEGRSENQSAHDQEDIPHNLSINAQNTATVPHEETPNTPTRSNYTFSTRKSPDTTPRQRQGSILTLDALGIHDLGIRPLDYLNSRPIHTRHEEDESEDGKVDWEMTTPGSVD